MIVVEPDLPGATDGDNAICLFEFLGEKRIFDIGVKNVNTNADNDSEGQKWSLAALKKRLSEDPSIGPERLKNAFDAVNDIFIKN